MSPASTRSAAISVAVNTESSPRLPPLALIAGPTASGKSAVALALAEQVGGVVINADSAQVYADLRVLSARPGPTEEASVPHRLFGHVGGADSYSAARWASEARAAIRAAHEAGQLPILVGGTGLYLRTLIDGIAPVPDIDPAVRAAVRAMPVDAAHASLAVEDPAAAARLAATDTTRVARALEVVRSSGRTLAAWQQDRQGGIGGSVRLAPLLMLPDRAWLFERIEARFGGMFAGGAVEEVAALIARADILPSAPVRRAIGVAEIAGMLDGRWSRAEAIERTATATRQYAKRQYTWFRNQPSAGWPRVADTDPASLADLLCKAIGG